MTSRLRQQVIAVVLAGLWLLCGEGAAPVDAASLTRVGTVGTAALSGKAHDVVSRRTATSSWPLTPA